jgi:hypothetical protein
VKSSGSLKHVQQWNYIGIGATWRPSRTGAFFGFSIEGEASLEISVFVPRSESPRRKVIISYFGCGVNEVAQVIQALLFLE